MSKQKIFSTLIIVFQVVFIKTVIAQTNVDHMGHIKITSKGKITMSSNTMQHPTNISTNVSEEYDLFVRNGIITKDYGIYPDGFWADYVFKEDYKLLNLKKLKEFIAKNKHLPNIPSQKEIASKGYKIHQMNVLFLEKIEELTLYILMLEEKLSCLEKKLKSKERETN